MGGKFQEWADQRHQYASRWKERTGGKVVGYLCTYVPEEILYAAGVLPVRILGSHQPSSWVEPHIFGMFCPFCRDCLAEGLEGRYPYLDGIVLAQSCLHIRQTFWSWQKHIPVEYSYYLYMPHSAQSQGRYEFLRGELAAFQESLEKWLGKTISTEQLDRAIEVYNRSRRLLHQVYEWRKKDRPPLTGKEVMEIALSSQLVDKEEHNQALEALLQELPQRESQRETGVRLMMVGSEHDDRDFMEMVEQRLTLPATFVIEDHCTGSRYFWNPVILRADRLAALSARYLDRPPCPSKDWPSRKRFSHLSTLAREYNVQAAILTQQKFCDPHELDMPALRRLLDEQGIPHTFLEFDITTPAGQFQTRVEAFLETLVELV